MTYIIEVLGIVRFEFFANRNSSLSSVMSNNKFRTGNNYATSSESTPSKLNRTDITYAAHSSSLP